MPSTPSRTSKRSATMSSSSSRPSKRSKTSHNSTPLLVTRVQPHRQCANRPPRFWRFQELPAEIRNMIYSQILTIPTSAHDVAHVWNEKPRFDLSLLHVNKQISEEAAFVLYSTNTFVFLEPCDEHRDSHPDSQDPARHRSCSWLRAIGPRNAQSVRNLHLRIRAERFSHMESMSYNPDLILEVAGLAPKLTHLAIIAEKHAMQTRTIHIPIPAGYGGGGGDGSTGQQQTGQAMETHYHRHWDPNHVAPINTWTLYQMRIGLRKFPNLMCLVLAVFQRSDTFFRPMVRLINKDRRCKIHVVTRSAAKRTDRSRPNFSTLWDEEPVLDQMGRYLGRGGQKKGGGGSCSGSGSGSGANEADATTGGQNTTTGQNADPGGQNVAAQNEEESDDDDDDAASDDGWQDIEALISDSGDEDEGEEDDMII